MTDVLKVSEIAARHLLTNRAALSAIRQGRVKVLEIDGDWCVKARDGVRAERLVREYEPPAVVRYTATRNRNIASSIQVDGVDWYNGSFVYFISDGEFVKIGMAFDVSQRLRDLQIANPRDLQIVASVRGGRDVEADWHAEFREFHRRGEWFALPPDAHSYVRSLGISESFTATEVPTEVPTRSKRAAFLTAVKSR